MSRKVFCGIGIFTVLALAVLILPNASESVPLQANQGAGERASQTAAPSSSEERRPVLIERAPARVIEDPHAAFSAVAVDAARDEIVLQDENRHNIMIYNRLDNTPPQAAMTEPKRMIGGPRTKVQFNCGVYVDPFSGDIYSLAGDVMDTMTVFSRQAKGNVPPDRELHTPHRTFGVAIDEEDQELYLTIQHPPAVVVYNKTAKGNDAPIRILEGDKTQMADVHGIALDTKNHLLYLGNRGAWSQNRNGVGWARAVKEGVRTWEIPLEKEAWRNMVPGSGKFLAPSITVYPLKASGDTPPLRVIQGSQTMLNWPAHISLDVEHGEVFVADAITDAILVFRATDSGNVKPLRVLKGSRTGIRNPHGVYADVKNDEIVVANFGNHAATVYPRTASGNAPPIRIIRGAPLDTPAPMLGNVGALAYDTKRDEILAPN